MSICIRWAERPNGIVGRAYERAMGIVHTWLDNRDAEMVRGVTEGWASVSLAEKIAYALLEADGYDEGLLEAAVDGDFGPGCTAGDLDAELEQTRARR